MAQDQQGVRATSNLLWTAVGLVLLAVNLRPAIGSVSPLLGRIQEDLGLSGATISLLTTLPVLCLGVFALLAPAFARRIGVNSAVTLALVLIVVGLAIRFVPAVPTLFVGTVLAGAGLAIGNVLIPAVVKSAFPDRIRFYTGLATAVLSGGAALASGVTVPLRDGLGVDWPTALALWAGLAILALVVWVPLALSQGRPRGAAAPPPVLGGLLRDAVAWQATLYLALRALAFFTALGWLPTILIARGAAEAGAVLSLCMLVSIPAAVLAPVLSGRLRPATVTVAVAVLGAVANLGLIVQPDLATFWAVILGLALGGGFAMAMTFIGLRSPDPGVAAQLSGMVQTVGYIVGAVCGPLLFGLIGSVTGSWTPALALLIVLAPVELVIGLLVSRDRKVLASRTGDPVAAGG
ncbi:MFS transporter [Nocardiopsis sp. FIRDI 009]|uniref:CynX/NimT family MFS transporter n=1 Tax=Nocardiopsis sp. FIRDI 009 TaxID=714197 RepID=UPI001E4CF786|nr:MFS transporter [Nocardiopsis sp. FIRDI 009]